VLLSCLLSLEEKKKKLFVNNFILKIKNKREGKNVIKERGLSLAKLIGYDL
jgi:hypothetical protein